MVVASKAEGPRLGAAAFLLDEPVEPVAEQKANVADLEVPVTPPVMPAPGTVWLALGKTRFVLV